MDRWLGDAALAVSKRIFAAWAAREVASVSGGYGQWHGWHVHADTDGCSIFDWHGDCLLTRPGNGFLALITAKSYRTTADARWLVDTLTALAAEHGLETRNVRTPELCSTVRPEDLERWWRVEREWQRGGADASAKRYLDLARRLVDAWASNAELVYNDGFRFVEATARAVWVMGEPILARPKHGRAALSELNYPRRGERYRFREAIRVALDERRIPYVMVRPKRSGALTWRRELLAAAAANAPTLVRSN